jgi:crotonobetainyl-CoA:carnitine CoA-transferase CaiB-like acyl-CoA transferase
VSYEQPYAGIKIIDLSQAIAGPYAAALLAQQGADVIKVEPHRGDWMRWTGYTVGDHSTLSMIANLGKRSLAVDLKTEEGLEIVRQLIAEADIFMESFRPGVITRLGLGYEAVAALNPRIIYLSVSGFGQQGPMRERPGTDGVIQAFSGFMSVNKGSDGVPHRAGLFHADLSTALYNLQALQSALWARQAAGTGCYIENSLLRAATAFHNMNLLTEHLAGPDNRPGAYPSETFETADGFINLAVIYDHEFPVLCDLLGLAEFRDHPEYQTAAQRYARRDVLEPVLRQAIRKESTDYWCERLTKARLLHERVHTYTEFLNHPQPAASGALTWIEHPHAGKIPLANTAGIQPHDPDQPWYAPAVGEHSETILQELGYSAEHIDDLVTRSVVVTQHASGNREEMINE